MSHSSVGFSWKEAAAFSLGGWRAFGPALVAASVILKLAGSNSVLVFAVAALALVPLAGSIGQSTEELAGHMGATIGGLLNAALGNITELIFGILALWAGHTEIVKASITGSIIGNLLLVFGLAAFVGGIGRERLRFSQFTSSASLSMLFLAVVALVMPALFQFSVFGSLEATGARIERLSLWAAAILLASYLASLVFMLRTHRSLFRVGNVLPPTIGRGAALFALTFATVLAAIATKVLVSQLEPAIHALGWTDLFAG
ncbi:MAG: cation transporter, partial [Acidobacteriota bacterium]|nr:cation transporter [Acidobacteriota bacterium]